MEYSSWARKTSRALLIPFLLATVIVTGTDGDKDDLALCKLTNEPMYCLCQPGDGAQPRTVNCHVTRKADNRAEVFNAFSDHKFIVSVTVSSFAGGPQLEFVPEAVLHHSRLTLEHFKISRGNLGPLKAMTFSSLPKLAVLSLDSNQITDLEVDSISNLPSLRKLELGDNKLKTIRAGALHQLPNLTHLFLERNEIGTIESQAFRSLHNLSELVLADNAITDLSANTFKGLKRVTRIDLFRNKLKRLVAHVFSGMPYLLELDLKRNEISEVDPFAFDELPQLRIMYLADNRLRILPVQMFRGAPNLALIDLSANELQTLTWRTVQDLKRIDADGFSMQLKGNKFACDCRIVWILHLEKATRDHNFRRELRHIKCDFADPMKASSKVVRLSEEQLNCESQYKPPVFRAASARDPPKALPTASAATTPGIQGSGHKDLDNPTVGVTTERYGAMPKDGEKLTNAIVLAQNQHKAAKTEAATSRTKKGENSPASASSHCGLSVAEAALQKSIFVNHLVSEISIISSTTRFHMVLCSRLFFVTRGCCFAVMQYHLLARLYRGSVLNSREAS